MHGHTYNHVIRTKSLFFFFLKEGKHKDLFPLNSQGIGIMISWEKEIHVTTTITLHHICHCINPSTPTNFNLTLNSWFKNNTMLPSPAVAGLLWRMPGMVWRLWPLVRRSWTTAAGPVMWSVGMIWCQRLNFWNVC